MIQAELLLRYKILPSINLKGDENWFWNVPFLQQTKAPSWSYFLQMWLVLHSLNEIFVNTAQALSFSLTPFQQLTWRLKKKRVAEDEMIGLHHRFNGHELGQTLGDDEGQGDLACCHLWGRKKSNMTRQLNNHNHSSILAEESCEQRSLAGYSPWDRKESYTT